MFTSWIRMLQPSTSTVPNPVFRFSVRFGAPVEIFEATFEMLALF